MKIRLVGFKLVDSAGEPDSEACLARSPFMFKLEPDCVTVDTVLCRRIRRTLRLAGGPGPPSPRQTTFSNKTDEAFKFRCSGETIGQNCIINPILFDESFVTSARDRKA